MSNAQKAWKPRTPTTYETMILTDPDPEKKDAKVVGAGFRPDGQYREFMSINCHLTDIRRRC